MSQKFFFRGLNELRALAALSVIVHHLELYCFRDKKTSLYNVSTFEYFINSIGKNGVYLFFVLSGFLITFLLLKEKEQSDTISIKNFYLRRVFRIWPLYMIIIVLSIVVLPVMVFETHFFDSETFYMALLRKEEIYSTTNILLYVFFLSNFALPMVGAAQTWSVSVEEQFYLVWPQIVKRFSRQKLLYAFVLLFVFFLAYQALHLPYSNLLKKIPLEIMAIGGVFAYFWYYHKNRFEKYFESNGLFALNLIIIFFGIFFPVPRIIVAVFFGLLILFVITERKWNLRSKWLAFLGTISYGIYMYHPIMMFISSAFINKFVQDVWIYKLFLYILTGSTTILVSYLSYKFVEKRLIDIKDKKFSSLK